MKGMVVIHGRTEYVEFSGISDQIRVENDTVCAGITR